MNKPYARGWIFVVVVAMLFVLAGCGNTGKDIKQLDQAERDRLPAELSHLSDVYAAYGVHMRSSYSTNDVVIVEVLKTQKPWETLTDEETDRLKQAIYNKIGYAFALRIDSFAIPAKADITGKITALDGRRVLIVGDAASGSNPSAMWVTFPPAMTEELKIGYKVNAWSDGMVMDSYPGQTSGVQLQVVDFDVGDGDLQGEITALDLDQPNSENNYIEVDHVKLRVLPITIYQWNGQTGNRANVKIGSKVQAWTLRYEITPDTRFASQINVITSK
ncbi:DUF3221 domain-containing protein [Cohnella yongneupensis]|uniref:DUF3221 domain-containing protein n=1 Tax=Cohnella yongneupensis TaxID=425006 RepID=A0ABW0QXF9_9BACL